MARHFLIMLLGLTAVMAGRAEEENITVITSDKLVFDAGQHFAAFDGNVEVTDPSMKMTSDSMKVLFDEDNQVKHINAVGNVVITQEDKIAWAGKAVYDVVEGKITLTEKPRIKQGEDMLQGGTITFWRDENRMECYPRAKLIIHPGSGKRKQLSGGY